MFQAFPDMILDGELYADKFSNDFNAIISLVKKSKPTRDDLDASREHIRYFNYDMPGHGDLPFSDRLRMRNEYFEGFLHKFPCFHAVETIKVENFEHMDILNEQYLQMGMEGQMIRIDGHAYENKRVKHLLKRKIFDEEEFVIADIIEGIGNRSGMAGFIVYYLKGSEGETFKSGIRGGEEFYVNLLMLS